MNKKNATRIGWIFTIVVFGILIPLLMKNFSGDDDRLTSISYVISSIISTSMGLVLTKMMKFDFKNKKLSFTSNGEFILMCIFFPWIAGYTLYLIVIDKNEIYKDDNDFLQNNIDTSDDNWRR